MFVHVKSKSSKQIQFNLYGPSTPRFITAIKAITFRLTSYQLKLFYCRSGNEFFCFTRYWNHYWQGYRTYESFRRWKYAKSRNSGNKQWERFKSYLWKSDSKKLETDNNPIVTTFLYCSFLSILSTNFYTHTRIFYKVDEYIAAVIIGNSIFACIKGLHKHRKCQGHLFFSRHLLIMLYEIHDLYIIMYL